MKTIGEHKEVIVVLVLTLCLGGSLAKSAKAYDTGAKKEQNRQDFLQQNRDRTLHLTATQPESQLNNGDIPLIQNRAVVDEVPDVYILTIKPPDSQQKNYLRTYRDTLSKMATVEGWFDFGSLVIAVVRSDAVTAAEFSQSPYVTLEANLHAFMIDR